jgi:hypothetical protein
MESFFKRLAFLFPPELQSILTGEDNKDPEISVYNFEASRPLVTLCRAWTEKDKIIY